MPSKRALAVVVFAFAPLVAIVACETKPSAIRKDQAPLVCPSAVAPVCAPAPPHSGHTTYHVCHQLEWETHRPFYAALESADSHCSSVTDCAEVVAPPHCGFDDWGCVPRYVNKGEHRVADAVDSLRAGACSSWVQIGCDDYFDDPPACSYTWTPACVRGYCSVDAKYIGAAASSHP